MSGERSVKAAIGQLDRSPDVLSPLMAANRCLVAANHTMAMSSAPLQMNIFGVTSTAEHPKFCFRGVVYNLHKALMMVAIAEDL